MVKQGFDDTNLCISRLSGNRYAGVSMSSMSGTQ